MIDPEESARLGARNRGRQTESGSELRMNWIASSRREKSKLLSVISMRKCPFTLWLLMTPPTGSPILAALERRPRLTLPRN